MIGLEVANVVTCHAHCCNSDDKQGKMAKGVGDGINRDNVTPMISKARWPRASVMARTDNVTAMINKARWPRASVMA